MRIPRFPNSNRKLLPLNVLLLAGGLLWGACSAGTDQATTDTTDRTGTPVDTTPYVPPTQSNEDQFIGQLESSPHASWYRADSPTWKADIVELARTTCAALDSGATIYDVVGVLLGGSDSAIEPLSYAVGAGIATFCPEHMDQVNAL